MDAGQLDLCPISLPGDPPSDCSILFFGGVELSLEEKRCRQGGGGEPTWTWRLPHYHRASSPTVSSGTFCAFDKPSDMAVTCRYT